MIITKDSDEFKNKYAALRPERSLVLDALEESGAMETWPVHLKNDALKRMGLKEVVMYEVIS